MRARPSRRWRRPLQRAPTSTGNDLCAMRCEVLDICPGLWIWRLAYPDWREEVGWEQVVSSTCVESRGEVVLIDPLAPPEDATEVWERLDAHPPTVVVVLKPDHVRDVDL